MYHNSLTENKPHSNNTVIVNDQFTGISFNSGGISDSGGEVKARDSIHHGGRDLIRYMPVKIKVQAVNQRLNISPICS